MLEKTLSYKIKKMKGSMRTCPCGIYKYKKEYMAQINYSLSSIYSFILKMSDDIEIKFHIPMEKTMFFVAYKCLYFNDKRLHNAGYVLTRNIQGVILHRKIYRENNVNLIKELDETIFFRKSVIRIRSISNGVAYKFNIDNFLRPLEFDGINNDEIFEEITVSLIYNRSLLEDLEENVS